MKKLIILAISIMMILSLSSIVMAKADVQTLLPFPTANPIEPDASGKAIVNTSKGDVVLEITVSVKGLKAGEDYTVWLGEGGEWESIGDFTTNANGNGHFHRNIREDEDFVPKGEHIAINLKDPNENRLMDEDF